MSTYYTSEKNVRILLALMKAHGVRRIIASPGTTNLCFVASVQRDPDFTVYSAVDERSAAYMACGLAAETGEPVALSCTGATASRNYLPALTEAYYRKLPVLAVTSTQHTGRVGQHMAQVIDRSVLPRDTARLSVRIPMIHDEEDEWACTVRLNAALLELRRRGGAPVHLELATSYSPDYTVRTLPRVPVIRRIGPGGDFPELAGKSVAVFVGAHGKWSPELLRAAERFCRVYHGLLFCDHTSGYRGKYRVNASLLACQRGYTPSCAGIDVLIHIGEVSGACLAARPGQVWRVSPDGEVRDTFRRLRYVFEMEEAAFFETYARKGRELPGENRLLGDWRRECARLVARAAARMPEIPFSNPWIAWCTLPLLPPGSALHLGILNSLRCWDFFETAARGVQGYSNTGGFGIDGGLSALLGASLADPSRLFFGVTGDLAFFYDMNALGNRHLGKNVRILLINNGCGAEFRNYFHPAARFGEEADAYIAAAGHFGRQSPDLVRHYAGDLGFQYLSASTKEDYLEKVREFTRPGVGERPLLLEVFTRQEDESRALWILHHLAATPAGNAREALRDAVGPERAHRLRRMLKRGGRPRGGKRRE